jgi:hypothetical protein
LDFSNLPESLRMSVVGNKGHGPTVRRTGWLHHRGFLKRDLIRKRK